MKLRYCMPVFLLILAATITAKPFNNTAFNFEEEGNADEVERILIGDEPSNTTMESYQTTTSAYTELQIKMGQGVMMLIGFLIIIYGICISGPGRVLRGQ